MMSVEDSREFINSLYSEPEVSSMVDPDNGDDDIMGCVLEFFDENDLDSDSISYVDIVGESWKDGDDPSQFDLVVDDDGYIRGKILIHDDDNTTYYQRTINFVGYVGVSTGYSLIVFKEISWDF